MYYDTAPFARFDKPAKDAVVDLINKHNSTFFEYGELTLVSITALPPPPPAAVLTAANTVVEVRQASDEDGPTAHLKYHRLDITRYLAPGPHYFPASVPNAAEQALAYLDEFKSIWIAPDEATIVVNPDATDDGSFEVLITPVTDNPVWRGELRLNAVPGNHLGLHFSRFWFTRLRLEDLQVFSE